VKIVKRSLLLSVFAAGWLAAASASAQTPEEFYKGKSLRIIVGNSAGGDYDTMARLVAQHMGRHIPGNPSMIVQNMPGANGITAINHLYNVAPKDGTVMATLNRQIPKLDVLGRDALQADATRFGWLGGFGEAQQVCFASSRSSVKTAKDLFEKELTVGSTSQTSGPSVTPVILNKLLGTKFRVVQGYQSTPDVLLATTRGEVDGFCHSWALIKNQFGDMLRDGSIKPLIHVEESDFEDIPTLPSVFDLAQEGQKDLLRFMFATGEFGVSFVLPPNVPDDRLAALQKSFAALTSDAKFSADAAKQGRDITFHDPKKLMTLVSRLRAIPPEKLKELEKILPSAFN
jgi:tripartite-type tricarboxylate transporter receptor subunit TctC